MKEKIVETKNCKQCNISFSITDKDIEFYDKVSPKFEWKKYSIPAPTQCPDCRQQRRLAWRNETKLYKRKCDLTWKDIISVYSPDKNYKIYNSEDWWSDKWNPFDYWVDINFDNSFFWQFNTLYKTIPKLWLLNERASINSDYCNNTWWAWWNKNCYLLFIWSSCEDSFYCYTVAFLKNCFDILWWLYSENCYNCVKIEHCYLCQNSFNLKNCSESNHLIDCIWVKNSSFSVWLREKEYYFLNKSYSKVEYLDLLNKLYADKKFYNNTIKQFELLKNKKSKKALNMISCDKCYWDNLVNCLNCKNCFDINIWENLKFCYDWFNINNSQDTYISWSWETSPSDLLYEGENVVSCYNCIFCSSMNNSSNLIYCDICISCSNCFLCTWLRNKEYYILNKQYTKEEYNRLVPKIIEHMKKTWEWWEFFPSSISPFGYNETVANEYFPLEKEEAVKKWFNWSDYEAPFPKVEKIIPANKLPDSIKDIPDDILNWAIECEVTKKPFRIIKQELEFYRKHNLPIPRKHPDQRHLERMQLRNPRKLFDRDCDKCWVSMKTTYSSDREEKVYCEECYNKEVY